MAEWVARRTPNHKMVGWYYSTGDENDASVQTAVNEYLARQS